MDVSTIRAAVQAFEPVPLPSEIAAKVEQFRANIDEYRSVDFKEMALRTEFINPVMRALGWDVGNLLGTRFAKREVIEEDSVSIDGAQRAPDYCFLTGSVRRFFVEAKRPAVNIDTQTAPAYQIRRYCWSAGLPFGLVSDFEEFAIYDCRAVPHPGDSAHVGRIAYFKFEELEDYWGLLVALFGRDQVEAGSLERLAATTAPPVNTRAIDDAFLDELRDWRRSLASDIAVRNPSLDQLDLGSTIQEMLDRIVFLRIAEARGLEPPGLLRQCIDGTPGIYERLSDHFVRANDRYNSGLFHGAALPAGLTHLDVADELLESIIGRLYYPEPYEFSVLPADLLGHVYEQFLAEQISLAADRTVQIEVKPDLRKSGGVYYTPEPIVAYLVEETIGPLVKNRTPGEVARLRIVDPACGSGSFLIAAYQYLLDWHRDYYDKKLLPENAKNYLEVSRSGQVRVKTDLRRKILLNNIYGVDIDPQAVEVAKLSLLLKVIEDQDQMELEVGQLLPNLNENIRCGNSLIGSDFQLPLSLEPYEEIIYNPFDWESAFPEVFGAGGFHAVIGNPPYLNVDSVWGRHDPRLDYLSHRYAEVYTDKTDILFYFLKRSADLCQGELGFIVSRSFLEADKARKLRGWLGDTVRVREVLDFRHAYVFPGVGINTAIVRLTRSGAAGDARFRQYLPRELPPGYGASHLRDEVPTRVVKVKQSRLDAGVWNFAPDDADAVIRRIDAAGDALGSVLAVGKGMETGANAAFRVATDHPDLDKMRGSGLIRERARNSDINAYGIRPSGISLLYVEDVEKFTLLPASVQGLLKSVDETLRKRKAFERGDCDWWRYTFPLHKENFSNAGKKILCPYMASSNRFALDHDGRYVGLTDTTVLYDNHQPEDMRYFVGILNSRLLTSRVRYVAKLRGGGQREYFANVLSELRVPRSQPGDRIHDEIVRLVGERERIETVLPTALLADERVPIEARARQIEAEIEALVLELYGVSASDATLLAEHALAE